ncbi:MAG TPA: LacI family DNA-binding transcriptional regulator [Sphingomicrobium sp.]|jgi:LacI family transcriptional regulator
MAEATIRDVARKAQLSVATVSRALNGFDNVSEQAKEKVAAAVRDLGYVPHAGARSLSLARTNAIGVVLPDLHGEFFSEIVRGMDREASRRGYLLLLSNLHGSPEQASLALRAMHGRVDGLIVMAPQLTADQLGAALPAGLPSILVNTRGRGEQAAIHLDNAACVHDVVAHFSTLGRKRLVHIAGPEGNIDADERAAAFAEACAARGLECEILHGDFEEQSGERAVAQLLEGGHRFNALFAGNDNMAIGALQALQAGGLSVPGDVAVVGFDDIPLAKHLGLSTVRVRIAELGERALTRLLAQMVDRDSGGDELHAPELVVRATSAA